MGEELPSQYDVIILGTGAPETILAAAVARIGKTVLHLDRNEYYGGDWTSFNFDGLLDWIRGNQNADESINNSTDSSPNVEFLKDGESFITVGEYVSNISNVHTVTFVEETLPQVDEVPNGDVGNANEQEISRPTIENESTSDYKSATEGGDASVNVESGASASVEESSREDESVAFGASEEAIVEQEAVPTEPPAGRATSSDNSATRKIWCIADLKAQRRKFNLDLAPKLLFSRGPLVELLISSNISRYAEFKCTTRVLTYIDGQLVQVPCSRADVFSTKHVTVVEKRLLMKFLTFAMEYQKHPEEYRGFEGRPFIEFLKAKKLTRNVEHYLIHAIAMVDPNTPTLQSLTSIQKFLESLGRFGNSPFLWPLYGSAELPQCFCRLCAVFGGIYFLKRSIQALVTNSEGTCTAVISDGKRLDCSWFVMESGYAPRSLLPPHGSVGKISRGIFITDDSILQSEKEQLTLLCLPPDGQLKTTVTILELGPGASVCPNGLYVVYMRCQSSGTNAEEDLAPAVEVLFNITQEGGDSSKPRLLWCTYYNQKDTTTLGFSENTQGNVLLTSTPDLCNDYEQSVNEAKLLFERMFPGEEFLPRAPDPDEILLDTETAGNPGHSKEEETESSEAHGENETDCDVTEQPKIEPTEPAGDQQETKSAPR